MKFTYKSMILVFTFSIFDVKITTVDIIQCHFALVKASDKKVIGVMLIYVAGFIAVVIDFWLYNVINMMLNLVLGVFAFSMLIYFASLQNKRQELKAKKEGDK